MTIPSPADGGPRGGRRGALRGLPALPLPGERRQEPVPLAVRGARAARCRGGRRSGRSRAGDPSSCSATGGAAAAHRAAALPAAAAPRGPTRRRSTGIRPGAPTCASTGGSGSRGTRRSSTRSRSDAPRSRAAGGGRTYAVDVAGGEDVRAAFGRGELVGRLVRRRWPLAASVHRGGPSRGRGRDPARRSGSQNTATRPAGDKVEATRRSFLGAHLLLAAPTGPSCR